MTDRHRNRPGPLARLRSWRRLMAAALGLGESRELVRLRAELARLRQDRNVFRDALGLMDQGIMVVNADLSVPLLSNRAARLIGLPPEFAATSPSFPDLLAYQVASGAITEEVRRSSINSFIVNGEEIPETHVYERETFDGLTLDARTTRTPGGGFVRTFTDQTARKRRDQELKVAQTDYRTLFENAEIGIYRSNCNGAPQRVNPALVMLSGYDSEAELLAAVKDTGIDWYVDPTRRPEFQRLLTNDGNVADFVSEIYRHKTGEKIWVSETAWQIRDASGAFVGYEGCVIDASERIHTEAKMQHMARHDELTGLANRRYFNELLAAACDVPEPCVAILTLDLDRFKMVNDALGHMAGDSLLQALAGRFAHQVRDGDTVARIGGDEFAVLLPETGRQMAQDVAVRLHRCVMQPVEIAGKQAIVGVSIGIAIAPENGSTPEALLICADAMLYEKKGRAHTEAALAPVVSQELRTRLPQRRSGF